MTGPLAVADIASYLRDTGWRREPEEWRGASIWVFGDDYEVLVPGRDGMGDGDMRIRDIVDALVAVENRPREEIALDIQLPLADSQRIRMFPTADIPAGFTALRDGLRALRGVEGALRAAARAEVEGPQLAFRGDPPAEVEHLLARVQLGPASTGSYVLPVRVPLDERGLGRRVTLRLHSAIAVLAAGGWDSGSHEISADLCESLSLLGGADRQAFEIGFRWARGRPVDLPAVTYPFRQGAAEALRSAAADLRQLSSSDTVTGLVQSLHDDIARDDRWAVEVRGTGRAVWVRLPDRGTYEQAIAAHRAGRQVRVRGETRVRGRRTELTATRFEILEE